MQYYQPKSHWFLKLMILLTVIIVILYVVYRFNLFHLQDKYKPKIDKMKSILMFWKGNDIDNTIISSNVNYQQQPKIPSNWCVRQIIQETNSVLSPVYHERLGFDTTSDCCLDIIRGWSCKKNKTSEVRYCFSGDINTQMVYVETDGLRQDVTLSKEIIDNINKKYIPEIELKCGLDKTFIYSKT